MLALRELPQLDLLGRLVVSDGENMQLCTIHLGRKFCPELSRLQRVIRPVCRNENALSLLSWILPQPSALDADERHEPRHAPGKSCMLRRQDNSADILVGAWGLLGHAAH